MFVRYSIILCARCLILLLIKATDLFNSIVANDERQKIDLAQCPRADFGDFLSAANIIKDMAETRRYPCTKNLQNVFWHINRYAAITV